MDDPDTLARMRADWNARAAEDANYYAAFNRREQGEEEFFSTGADVVRDLELHLPRLRGKASALEIGCGPGRLLRPMSRHFAEIHGVDVSDEMVRLARERLRDTPNAHAHLGSGAGLELFADNSFDFVYSYAVFQHIPSRDVVFHYLREAHRVLRPGGVLRCQLDGLPARTRAHVASPDNTWSGARIAPGEIAQFARDYGFQLLALEQIWTQYMWITCRKWVAALRPASGPPRIRRITSAIGKATAPVAGPLASLTVSIENLPAGCDLNAIAIGADGRSCRPCYIGEPEHDGVTQVNAELPPGLRTGLVPIEAFLHGNALCPAAWIRMIPAGPPVPRIVSISDGINLLSGNIVASGIVKAVMAEINRPGDFRATVDGRQAAGVEMSCVNPLFQSYEFNFPLPAQIGRGPHEVRIAIGKREFGPVPIEVA